LAGKANCAVVIKFKPTATGTRDASMSITDTGGSSPQKVELNGIGK
jgi:hypothetical protein